jgi:transposase
MKHRRGLDRSQTLMFPERLEDYVAAENPVRFLDAFVGQLDLGALGFAKAQVAATGRPPYDPAALLKLYLYGYLHRIRSSRLLETECQRNVEVIWLLGKLAPDFKTIADFRKDNLKPLRAVSGQFTVLCRKLELFGGQLLAIDGSKTSTRPNWRSSSGGPMRGWRNIYRHWTVLTLPSQLWRRWTKRSWRRR